MAAQSLSRRHLLGFGGAGAAALALGTGLSNRLALMRHRRPRRSGRTARGQVDDPDSAMALCDHGTWLVVMAWAPSKGAGRQGLACRWSRVRGRNRTAFSAT
ncbi:twin-arginine translocation signal domain-containing protein [Streptomyces sp. NPDC051286]|uniref:twin-arginine translocation signal domain-containing protein n=1 Tax=Streptomyces sp. NPDC051286 TaxID=3365647 RepID=UPI0037BA54F1